ncbi:hypothetical protein DVH24_038565 [Malus domestica]|uniref:Uncharacterized protein n=1 Tax=Malus domestica TaxID=3750 RepID=A0A498K9V1_MALDO|nr:hypothetical protein DVH24_038565 [Malus domestica]
MYIMALRSSIEFSGLNGIADLAQKMVETKKGQCLPFSLLAVGIGTYLTSCNSYRGEGVLCYEGCEEPVAQSNGRSKDG